MEALLRRCRPPEPPPAVERRVLAEVRRLRRKPSRLFAAVAILLFAAVLFAVIRPGPSPTPGGGQNSIRQWKYTYRRGEQVVAVLSADEAVLVDGIVKSRRLSAKLFPAKGPAITIQADSGRFDGRDSRVALEGSVRIDLVEGFASATIDLREESWTAVMDLAARFAKAANSAPENYRPNVAVEGRSAVASDTEMTFVDPAVTLTCPGWAFSLSGPQGRSDRTSYSITGNVRAIFEDGSTLQVAEAAIGNSQRTLRLKASFK
jgi:hypothetical protein